MTLVMGIVNVTPDSFSDGGRYATADAATAHARSLLAAGADIVDVGGESTRPGADRVDPAIERDRALPVVAALAADGALVSIDTMNAETAVAAVAAGARIVNDVSGGLADPDMLTAVAATDADVVLGHWRGHSADMYAPAVYDDVVAEVRGELQQRVAAAVGAGIRPERIIVDPGIGFGKRGEQNWQTLRGLDTLVALGPRVLVGTSRKRFLADVLGADATETRRDLATAVTSVMAARAGVWGVRVHDVTATRDALRVAACGAGPARKGRPMDEITLTGVRGYGHHGVYDDERREGQEFIVDVTMRLDLAPAAASDDVADTVHYGEVAERIVEIIEGPPADLIEVVAERIADDLRARERVRGVTVTVHKPSAPITVPFSDVSVTVRRGDA
ncbi:dihydropteroate synthase [Microbacterium koreense]|uniref:7,8-dihydroneopterin aldolase n=1 Tax=Microbacterium koreense TaxID=323761 RepID=A0ABW2ZP35_9MICO